MPNARGGPQPSLIFAEQGAPASGEVREAHRVSHIARGSVNAATAGEFMTSLKATLNLVHGIGRADGDAHGVGPHRPCAADIGVLRLHGSDHRVSRPSRVDHEAIGLRVADDLAKSVWKSVSYSSFWREIFAMHSSLAAYLQPPTEDTNSFALDFDV